MDAPKSPKHVDFALGQFGPIWVDQINTVVNQSDTTAVDQSNTKDKSKKAVKGGNILKGVYKLQGKQLIYCLSAPGKARPKTFTITKGSGETLVTLKRFSTGEAKIEAAMKKLGGRMRKDGIGWITSVSFNNTKLADDDLKLFGKLSKLTSITIVNSPLTGADLSHFQDIHTLHNLTLTGTQITDDGLLHLRKMNKLQTLHISNTQISNAGLKYLRGFKELYNLHLSRTYITDNGLANLKDLPALDSLFIENTRVTDAGLVHLAGLHKLSYLRLAGTEVTDAGVKQLSELPNLKNVSLGGTHVTDAGLLHLRKLSKLKNLSLVQPKMKEPKPVELTPVEQRAFGLGKDPLADTPAEQRSPSPKLETRQSNPLRVTDEGIAELKKALPKLKIRR